MDATLNQLGGILLKAVPTIILLLVVFLYLKWMFFRPLEKVLAERKNATAGTREKAEALLAKADQTAAAVESELRKARESIYQEQEEARRRWAVDQAAQLEKARHSAREMIHQAQIQLESDTAEAKRELAGTAESLAEQIADTLLERKTV
ncbi:MAG TPA: ATP synthase F0 subunit B [Bryobacteraceae bacterium]|nr:ATP synthase F0 subunit B [Bryobacteraceae bacterium]